MSDISRMIRRAFEGSDTIKIVKVPPEKRPTAESLRKLDREIKAQLNANEAISMLINDSFYQKKTDTPVFFLTSNFGLFPIIRLKYIIVYII